MAGRRAQEATNLFGQEISTNSGLVLIGELLVHILVHERRLANTAITEDDNLQQHLLASSGHDGERRISIKISRQLKYFLLRVHHNVTRACGITRREAGSCSAANRGEGAVGGARSAEG